MTITGRLLAIVLGVLLAGSGGLAQASLQVATDRAEWVTLVNRGAPDRIENFDSLAVDALYSADSPLAVGTFLTLTTNGSLIGSTQQLRDLFRVDADPPVPDIEPVNASSFIIAGAAAGAFDVGTVLQFPAMAAFGFEFGKATESQAGTVTVQTSLGDTATFTLTTDSGGFFGLYYDAGETFESLTWLSPVAAGNFAAIDNIEAFTPVPLPAAVWLLGSGFLVVASVRRRCQAKR